MSLQKRISVVVRPAIFIIAGFISISNLNFGGLLEWELEDQSDYESELRKAYNTLTAYGPSHSGFYSANEVSTDEMAVPTKGADWFDDGIWVRNHQHQYLSSDSQYNNAWTAIYGGIAQCNKLLFQFSKISSPDVNIYVAELWVLRAFYYYLLLDSFGNTPIIDSFFPSSPGVPATNNRQELYDYVEAEILAAIPDLSADPIYGRLNQSAARALLAKLYLNAEVYTGTPEWVAAIDQCDEIINSGYYALQSDFYENFYGVNDTISETIFQIPYDAAELPGFNIGQMSLHYASQATFDLQQQPWNGYATLEEFYNLIDSSDVRKEQFLAGPQVSRSDSLPLEDPSSIDPNGPEVNFTPEINELFPNAYREAGARIFKWKYEIGAGPDLNNDFAIFRYADILLMKAEASFRTGNTPEALSLVNQIRARAGVAPLASVTLIDILDERGRELFAEGWRRQDLIRFGLFNDAWWEKPVSTSDKNIFPIPQVQLDRNPNLVQNPGY